MKYLLVLGAFLLGGCAKPPPALTPNAVAWSAFSTAIVGARSAAETCGEVIESLAARGEMEKALRLNIRCETEFETVKGSIRSIGEAIDSKEDPREFFLPAAAALGSVCRTLRAVDADCPDATKAAVELLTRGGAK